MTDNNLKEEILYKFLENRIKKRIMWELFSDKREVGILRFSHRAEGLIKEKYIYEVTDNSNVEIQKIVEGLVGKNLKEKSYLISDDSEIDKKELPLKEALECYLWELGPLIIIVSENVVLIKEEQAYGSQKLFILYDEAAKRDK